jgi:4-amino-4-deoxy-L-arabinose transferase-like glycosyltransferase
MLNGGEKVAKKPWLTLEVALWGGLLVAVLGLRLFRLGAAPLNGVEARGALAAWRLAHGQGAPATSDYSPLLFSAQWVIFLLIGAGDQGARLLPALAGSALVLAPALLRQQLGRLGALGAGLLLALSPTALTLSRTASGDVLVALGALLCASALCHWLDPLSHDRAPSVSRSGLSSFVHLLPLALALVLTSSPLAYSALLSLGVAFLPLLAAPRIRARLRAGWQTLRLTPDRPRQALGAFVGGFVLCSTALAWNLGGLGAAARLLLRWLDGFVRWPDSLSLGYPLLILCVYEPFILLAGGAGAILATRQGHTSNATARFMALWSVVALALALLRPGHGPGDVLLVLLPLACLGGLALETLLVTTWRSWGQNRGQPAWLNTALYTLANTLLWAHLALNLANYVHRPGQYAGLDLLFVRASLPSFVAMALVSAVMLLGLAATSSAVQGLGATLRDLGLSTTLVLVLFTLSTAWNVSQNRPADPRELLVLEPTAGEVRLLVDSLVHFSNQQRGKPHAIDLGVLSDDPALAWTLRDFRQVRFADGPGEAPAPSAIITLATMGVPDWGQEGYVGQSFPLRRRWRGEGLACRRPAQDQTDCSALVRWFIFRRSPTVPAEERVVLWLRRDLVWAE